MGGSDQELACYISGKIKISPIISLPYYTHAHTRAHAHTHTHTHTHSEDRSREVCDFFYFLKSPKLKASDFKLLISFIFPRLKLMEVLEERDMFEPISKAVKAVLLCSSSSPYGKVFKVEILC